MNWIQVIAVSAVLFTLNYVYFVLSSRRALLRIKPSPPAPHKPSVSVLIAARNEENHLAACLRSVLTQDYPVGSMEVILIDDGSTDHTSAIARDSASRDSRLTVLALPDAGSSKSSRKPVALAAGIERAKGEIILTTDADCTVGPFWISSMVRSFDADTAFVAGPVQETASSSLISQLSRLEFLGIIGVSAGLISRGTPIICNGANVAYRREAFLASEGFGKTPGFCDDEVLMHRINARGLGAIRCTIDGDSMVTTHAPSTLGDFLNQRIRWSSKRGHYHGMAIVLRLSALYFFFLMLLILLVASIFLPSLLPVAAAVCVVKCATDLMMLRSAGRLLHQRVGIGYFLIAELLHVPYIVGAALAGQVFSLKWKGQRLRG